MKSTPLLSKNCNILQFNPELRDYFCSAATLFNERLAPNKYLFVYRKKEKGSNRVEYKSLHLQFDMNRFTHLIGIEKLRSTPAVFYRRCLEGTLSEMDLYTNADGTLCLSPYFRKKAAAFESMTRIGEEARMISLSNGQFKVKTDKWIASARICLAIGAIASRDLDVDPDGREVNYTPNSLMGLDLEGLRAHSKNEELYPIVCTYAGSLGSDLYDARAYQWPKASQRDIDAAESLAAPFIDAESVELFEELHDDERAENSKVASRPMMIGIAEQLRSASSRHVNPTDFSTVFERESSHNHDDDAR